MPVGEKAEIAFYVISAIIIFMALLRCAITLIMLYFVSSTLAKNNYVTTLELNKVKVCMTKMLTLFTMTNINKRWDSILVGGECRKVYYDLADDIRKMKRILRPADYVEEIDYKSSYMLDEEIEYVMNTLMKCVHTRNRFSRFHTSLSYLFKRLLASESLTRYILIKRGWRLWSSTYKLMINNDNCSEMFGHNELRYYLFNVAVEDSNLRNYMRLEQMSASFTVIKGNEVILDTSYCHRILQSQIVCNACATSSLIIHCIVMLWCTVIKNKFGKPWLYYEITVISIMAVLCITGNICETYIAFVTDAPSLIDTIAKSLSNFTYRAGHTNDVILHPDVNEKKSSENYSWNVCSDIRKHIKKEEVQSQTAYATLITGSVALAILSVALAINGTSDGPTDALLGTIYAVQIAVVTLYVAMVTSLVRLGMSYVMYVQHLIKSNTNNKTTSDADEVGLAEIYDEMLNSKIGTMFVYESDKNLTEIINDTVVRRGEGDELIKILVNKWKVKRKKEELKEYCKILFKCAYYEPWEIIGIIKKFRGTDALSQRGYVTVASNQAMHVLSLIRRDILKNKNTDDILTEDETIKEFWNSVNYDESGNYRGLKYTEAVERFAKNAAIMQCPRGPWIAILMCLSAIKHFEVLFDEKAGLQYVSDILLDKNKMMDLTVNNEERQLVRIIIDINSKMTDTHKNVFLNEYAEERVKLCVHIEKEAKDIELGYMGRISVNAREESTRLIGHEEYLRSHEETTGNTVRQNDDRQMVLAVRV